MSKLIGYKSLLETGEINLTEWILLCKIIESEGNPITNRELSRYIKTTEKTVANVLNQLKKKEYIVTSYEEVDYIKRRIINITEKTEELIEKDRKVVENRLQDF